MKEIRAVEFTIESFMDYGHLINKEDGDTERLKQ